MAQISPGDYIRDPYSFFAAQHSIAPVTRIDFFSGPAWLVTGFVEAEAIMKDPRFRRENGRAASTAISRSLSSALRMKNLMFIVRDPPFHTRVRKLVARAFTPAVLERLRPAIRAIAHDLLAQMRDRPRHDLIADFAYRLPMYVICDLIGVPVHDRHYSRQWSEAFVAFIDFHTTPDDYERAAEKLLHANDYFHDLLRVRRAQPAADLLSELLAQQWAGADITDDEIVATCVMLLSAGHETTVNLIGNGYYLLLQHPEAMAKLRDDRRLLANTVEEVLRFEPPALTSSRWVAQDMNVFGAPMRAGDFVIIALGGAHRDPRMMEAPDEFRIARLPVRHLAFASGPHFCIGAHLARLEGQIALDMLLDCLDAPELLDLPQWNDSIALRGFRSLNLAAAIRLPEP